MIIGNSFLFGFCQIYSVNIPLYILLYSQILFYFPVLFFIFDAIKLLRIHKYRKRQEDARHIVMTILIIIAVVVVIFIAIYNSLVRKRNETENAFAAIDVMLKKRYDLIPNLVNTVKGYATHEKETLEGVVAARSQATQIKVDAADLTPEKLAQYQKAQGAVTSALGKLLAITENYPDLKANQNFLELQAQLEGTENRINVARKNFNDAAQAYNTNIRRFPKNIFAGMFGFDKKAYFEAEEGSEKAPKVEF
mgnify:CR=1 FL=1